MPEKFPQFDFSKKEDQEKFDASSKEVKDVTITQAQDEADYIKSVVDRGRAKDYADAEKLLDFKQKKIEMIDVVEIKERFLRRIEYGDIFGYPDEDIMKLKREIASLKMSVDLDLYGAIKTFEELGELDEIKARIALGIKYRFNGEVSRYLFEAILKYGNEEQIKKAISEYINQEGLFDIESFPFFKERFEIINKAFNEYREKYKIPKRYYVTAKILNAVCEIKKMNYDLAIGVLGGGATTAGLLELLGQETRYVEWHKKNKDVAPVWKKIGKKRTTIAEAKRIIICENDTETGATLNYLKDFFSKLNPELVDVSFVIDVYGSNESIVEQSDFYSQALQANKITSTNFIDNLEYALKIAKQYEAIKY